jgi:Tfp pilus assembly PilM family ATPase
MEHALAVDVKYLEYTDRLSLGAGVNRQAFAVDSDLLTVSLGLALRDAA